MAKRKQQNLSVDNTTSLTDSEQAEMPQRTLRSKAAQETSQGAEAAKQQKASIDKDAGLTDGEQPGRSQRILPNRGTKRSAQDTDPPEQPPAVKRNKRPALSEQSTNLQPKSEFNTLTTAKSKVKSTKEKTVRKSNALTADPLHDFTDSIEVNIDNKPAQLIAHLQVSRDPDGLASQKKLVMEFFLNTTKTKDVGHIVAFAVSKFNVNDAGNPAWIPELLNAKESPHTETGVSFRELLTQAGKPRAKVQQYSAALQAPDMIYLDAFELHGKGQGIGLSRPALQLFEDVLVSGGWSGTIVLSR